MHHLCPKRTKAVVNAFQVDYSKYSNDLKILFACPNTPIDEADIRREKEGQSVVGIY